MSSKEFSLVQIISKHPESVKRVKNRKNKPSIFFIALQDFKGSTKKMSEKRKIQNKVNLIFREKINIFTGKKRIFKRNIQFHTVLTRMKSITLEKVLIPRNWLEIPNKSSKFVK